MRSRQMPALSGSQGTMAWGRVASASLTVILSFRQGIQ